MLNKITKSALLIMVLSTISTHVLSEVLWVPGASVGLLKLEFGRPFSSDTTNADFTMLDVSLAGVFDSFYANLNISTPFSEADTSDIQGPVVVDTGSLTLTLGCNCIEAVSDLGLFVGYLTVDTDVSGAVPGFSFSEAYEDSGFFIGGNYPFISQDSGTLTGTVAYASLSGDVTIVDEFSSINNTFSGDTTGLSYGLNWTGGISQTMDYSIVVKIQDYLFETNSFKTDKKFTTIAAGVSYYF